MPFIGDVLMVKVDDPNKEKSNVDISKQNNTERKDEKKEKVSEREWDKGKKFNGANYGGDADIVTGFQKLKIFEGSGGKLYVEHEKKVEIIDLTLDSPPEWNSGPAEDGCIKEDQCEKKKNKEREWDRGKVWDEVNGMWVTKGRRRGFFEDNYYKHDER